jgi:pre-mRNA-processing factor 6
MSFVAPGPKTRETFEIGKPGNYVAGLGRGAIGFTTRSDIGPARHQPGGADGGDIAPPILAGGGVAAPAAPAGYVAGAGRGDGGTARGEKDTSNTTNLNDMAYDEFGGYQEKLFSDTTYEKDDEEADKIWMSVDNIMDTRRKRQREENMLNTMKKVRKERPKISDQFADLKRNLTSVSQEEWDAIPDVGDYASLRLRQKRQQVKMHDIQYVL